jgi:predicted nucleic acid-binding protein
VKQIVMDASVAAKWLLPSAREPLTDEAQRLLDLYTAGEIFLIVPDLFWAEITSFLWKSVRQGRCSQTTARSAFEILQQTPFPTVPSLTILERAFGIASEFGRSVYDSLYVALAVATNAQLITADEKLVNSLAARFPVKWLGAEQL